MKNPAIKALGAHAALAVGLLLAAGCFNEPIAGDSLGRDGDVAEAADGGSAPDAAAAGADAAVDALRSGRVFGTGAAGLNLRAAPQTDAEVLAVMSEGSKLAILAGPDGDWLEVRYQGTEGHASASYIRELDPDVSYGGLLMLLPWTPDTSYELTQAHGGFSHNGPFAFWSWDFGMPVGTPILAAHDGVVRLARGDSTLACCSEECASGANYVVIDRGDGTETNYVHLSATTVVAGDEVTRGDLIGYSGESGYVCGAHLHFQLQKSPAGGGGTGFANETVQGFFHDTGEALDMTAVGEFYTSKNGLLVLP